MIDYNNFLKITPLFDYYNNHLFAHIYDNNGIKYSYLVQIVCMQLCGFTYSLAQLTGAVEYTHCISVEGQGTPPSKCPEYDIKPSDGELWEMWSTPSLSLLLGSLWPGMLVPVRVTSMGQIEIFNHLTMCKQMTYAKLNCWK